VWSNFSGGVAMIKGSHRQLLVVVSLLFLLCVGALGGAPLGGAPLGGIPATFMTTTGETVQGNLNGISSVIRLSVPPPVTYVGPAQARDR
jgi:ferric-dicitrate binding protein FerR (iron transport regulator)